MSEPTDPRKPRASFEMPGEGPVPPRQPIRGPAAPAAASAAVPPPASLPVPPVMTSDAMAQMMAQAQAKPTDPLSQPYRLPSGGVFYPDPIPQQGGFVQISPMRGEQEEVLAGAAEGMAAGAALRHVVEQCVNMGGLPTNQLMLEDWVAILLNVLALSAGDDRINMRPVCGGQSAGTRGCGKIFDATMSLTDLPCITLRRPIENETPSQWPAASMDAEAKLMAEITGEAQEGPQEFILGPETREPFTTEPLPVKGDIVTFRYLRLADIIMAEQFSQQMESAQQTPGSPAHTFTLARHIVAINGQEVGSTIAATWLRRNPSRVNSALRAEIERRSFGYDVRPKFNCPHCGNIFRAYLPLDGRLFRANLS